MYEILAFLGPNELSVAERCPYNNYRGVRKEIEVRLYDHTQGKLPSKNKYADS